MIFLDYQMSDINTSSLLASGLALVPMPRGQKAPIDSEWNHQSNVVTDQKKIYLLEGKNIGIAHVYCTPTPTCALDIDNYPAAKVWLSTHSIELDNLLQSEGAVVIWSGKKFSLKLLYRLTDNSPPLESKKILGADGECALEFRCAAKNGKTVQDVLPPSLHPDGHTYQWLGTGSPLDIPHIPIDLLHVWRLLIVSKSRIANRKRCFATNYSPPPETPRQIATIQAALSHINADCDYEKWRNIVWAILSTGWLCAEDIALAWSQTAQNRFEDDAFWLVANSYIPDLQNQITVGSIYFHARNGGWNG